MIERRIAMVGTPCEIMAASKLQHYTDSPIDVKLGLFCMENFSYKYFVNLLKEYDLKMDDIEKFQIEKGYVFLLLKTKETVKIPLSVAKRIIRKNCNIWGGTDSGQAQRCGQWPAFAYAPAKGQLCL